MFYCPVFMCMKDFFLPKELLYAFKQHKFFTHLSKDIYSSSESLEEISSHRQYISSPFFHFHCIYVFFKILADNSFHLFLEQNQLILLTNKYN